MVKWAGKLLTEYQQFLKDHKLATGAPKDIKDEVKVFLGGIERLVDGFQEQSNEHWYYFMQQLSKFWIAEEHMARPQVSILNLELDEEDIPYHKEHRITIDPYTPIENRVKETIGYTSERKFQAYPFLYLRQIEFPSSQECRWQFTYNNEELPESFDAISIYLHWEKNQDYVYDILWFLKHACAQSSEITLDFPMYSFSYPADDVPLPYKHSCGNLMPYPLALDFFVEVSGIKKEHFKWDQDENLWNAEIVWRSEEIKLKDFQQIPQGIFKLHSIPLYHWIRKDLKIVQRRERIRLLGVDPKSVVWFKVSSHTEMMPLPYYLSHSLDKRLTGYIKYKENYIEVEATPTTIVEEEDKPHPINIEAMMIQDLKDKLSRYHGLKIDILDKIDSVKLTSLFLKKTETPGQEDQQKQILLQDHYQFWHKWRLSLRQWDESTLQGLLRDYFRHLSIENIEEIAMSTVQMRFIPEKGVFPVLAIDITAPEVTGKLWFALKRFYGYLKERAPICLTPYLEIKGKDGSIPIFSTRI